jgi:radical SAM superfamily enzyme YgiQ (UPF0313 family)
MENQSGKKGTVMLIAFYNTKSLGVRYLETALEQNGFETAAVYYKGFNSQNPAVTTETELNLLRDRIALKKPMLIGLSVMSSMYLETVDLVIEKIKSSFQIPVVCGGAYASMFPERFLDQGVEFVIRSDGENPLCQLADAVSQKTDYTAIPSLCYKLNGENVINDIGALNINIDDYGLPAVISKDACYIGRDTLTAGDPQRSTMSYEVVASRGCPFTCSYCCCVNLRRLLPKGTPAVRSRSVKSVIDELIVAKRELKRLVYIHFYDEIFPNIPGWIEEFAAEYKKHIHLPFAIWSHPQMVSADVLKKLVAVGLCEVTMGIQSGSEHIRKDIFHRYEKQGDIIKAAKTLKESGVRWISYDFMLQHPFESIEDLRETFEILKRFQTPFELQLHGMNFLPGTDIVPMAVEKGLLTEEELDKIMYATMAEQFGAYWKRDNDTLSQLIYELIHCQQFKPLRKKAVKLSADPVKHQARIHFLYKLGSQMYKLRYLARKADIVLKSKRMK